MTPDMMMLEGVPRHVKGALAHLNGNEPTARRLALDALLSLTNRYIIPNMDLAQSRPDGQAMFSLDSTVGQEVPGLALDALFTPQFADWRLPPDAVLEQALKQIDVDLPNEQTRTAFFRCWTAQTATQSARLLLAFLRKTPPPTDSAGREANALERMLDNPLPGELKNSILSTLFALSEAHARALRAHTTDPFVAETLDMYLCR